MSRYQLKIAMNIRLEETVLLYKSLTLLSQTLHSSQTEKEKEMLNMKIRRTCFMTALHVSALPSPKYFLKCKWSIRYYSQHKFRRRVVIVVVLSFCCRFPWLEEGLRGCLPLRSGLHWGPLFLTFSLDIFVRWGVDSEYYSVRCNQLTEQC